MPNNLATGLVHSLLLTLTILAMTDATSRFPLGVSAWFVASAVVGMGLICWGVETRGGRGWS